MFSCFLLTQLDALMFMQKTKLTNTTNFEDWGMIPIAYKKSA